MDEEIETQRSHVAYPMSHSWQVAERDLNPEPFNYALNNYANSAPLKGKQNQYSKCFIHERALSLNPQGKTSESTFTSTDWGTPEWAVFPEGTNKNTNTKWLVADKSSLSPQWPGLEAKGTNSTLTNHRRKSIASPLNPAKGDGHAFHSA